MPPRFDHRLLAELGMAELHDAAALRVLRTLRQTLERRAAIELSEHLTDAEVLRFSREAREGADPTLWFRRRFGAAFDEMESRLWPTLARQAVRQAPAILAIEAGLRDLDTDGIESQFQMLERQACDR